MTYAKEIILLKLMYNFSPPKMCFFGLEMTYAKEVVLLKLLHNLSPPKMSFFRFRNGLCKRNSFGLSCCMTSVLRKCAFLVETAYAKEIVLVQVAVLHILVLRKCAFLV